MNKKLHLLLEQLSAMEPLGIAYSGGLDSRFLALCAARAGVRFTLFHFSGQHVGKEETDWARVWAEQRGYTLNIVPVNVLDIPEVRENNPRRCYYCKHTLFSMLRDIAGSMNVCDGTNATDLQSLRPGLLALKELKIVSPLADAGFEKHEIRETARQLSLERPDQPARPCLLTRFAYDMRLTETELAIIGTLEEEAALKLRELFPNATESPDFRIRVTRDRRAELHATALLSPNQIKTLQDALNARLAQELAHTLAKDRSLETLATLFRNMPVHKSDAISGYHDQSVSSQARQA